MGSEFKVFVAGLPWSVDDNALWEAFKDFGEIPFCRVATDRETGKSRGFGFVSFATEEARTKAIADMHEKEMEGRWLNVRIAEDKPKEGKGKDKGGKGKGKGKGERAPDWDCPKCGASVFGSKDSCFKCWEPKPASAGADGAAAGGKRSWSEANEHSGKKKTFGDDDEAATEEPTKAEETPEAAVEEAASTEEEAPKKKKKKKKSTEAAVEADTEEPAKKKKKKKKSTEAAVEEAASTEEAPKKKKKKKKSVSA